MSDETALVVQRAPGLPDPATWTHMATIAQVLAESGMVPPHLKTPQAVLMVMLKARELAIPETMALTEISMIKGKPSCSAQLMLALIQRDHGGDALVFEDTTAEKCVISYTRRGFGRRMRYEFTLAEAQTAGLVDRKNADGSESNWKRYPKAMLRARCVSAVARMAFADTIGGMYLHEEVGLPVEIIEGEQVLTGEIVEAPPAAAAPTNGKAPSTERPRQPRPSAPPVQEKPAGPEEPHLPTDDPEALRAEAAFLLSLFPEREKPKQLRAGIAELRTALKAEPQRWQIAVNALLLAHGGLSFDGDEWVAARQARLVGTRLMPGALPVPQAQMTDEMLPVDLERLYEASIARWGEPELPPADTPADSSVTAREAAQEGVAF